MIEVMGRRRPDFRMPSLKLIVEFNGIQHYKNIFNWEECERRQRIDVWKTLKAMYEGYSVLHIRYDFLERSNWKDIYIHMILLLYYGLEII